MENIPVKVKLSNGMDTSRRLYQMSQKIRPLKKPPLPLININTKYVLCQKKFTVDFWTLIKLKIVFAYVIFSDRFITNILLFNDEIENYRIVNVVVLKVLFLKIKIILYFGV